jgi:hypothetical protein
MTGLDQVRAWIIAGFALLVMVYLWWVFARRPSRRDPKLAIISQLQGHRSLPLLQDRTIASRLAEIITAPLSRENFEQTLSISMINPTAEDFARRIPRIRIDTESKFDLVNVSSRMARVAIGEVTAESATSGNAEHQLPTISVDGVQYRWKESLKEKVVIEIAPGARRRVKFQAVHVEELPYIGVFPQTMPVRNGVEFIISTRVRRNTGLIVAAGSCQMAEYRHEWWKRDGKVDELTFRVQVTDPLLPGDAIILTIGA